MEYTINTHHALHQEIPIRLQEYGVGIFPTLSTRSALKKALKKGRIFVDGKRGETSTFIHGQEIITLRVSEEKTPRPFILKLEVVYEDEHFAVINKPAGVLTSGNAFKTIVNALEQNLKKSKRSDAINPQPAHRLDFSTTGLLLVGKTRSSLLALNQLFEQKRIRKTYIAVSIGEMKEKGVIDSMVDSKAARSSFVVLETVASERFQYLNLVELYPKTGRRHQLRKQLAEIGNPILGDAKYGQENLILKGKGMYLHALSLEFKHPISDEKVYFELELPSKFKKLFKKSRP